MRVAGHKPVPIVLMMEAQNSKAKILHGLGLIGVPPSPVRKVVWGTIDVDRNLLLGVEKVWSSAAGSKVMLGVTGEPQSLPLDPVQPLPFQVGAC